MHDVLLNLVAICCGLLVGVAVEPPAAFSTLLRPGSIARMCVAGAVALLALASFVSAAHLGTENKIGTPDLIFRSHYTSAQLEVLSRDRAARWRSSPPLVLKRYSQ